MRVLVVSTWYPSLEEPSQTPFIPRHVKAIARDHDVHVIHVRLLNRSEVSHEEYQGMSITRVGFDPRSPRSVTTAWREIRRWARCADVVHTMAFSSALVAAPVIGRTPWVHTEHWNGVLFPDSVNIVWEKLAWVRWVLRMPTLVTGVSTLMNESLKIFARPGRVRLLSNVVDFAPAVLPPENREPEIRIVAVGSLIERKDPLLAVETLAWLREQGIEASLTWDGTGPLLDKARRRAEELGVFDDVVFKGFQDTHSLWSDLARATVFLLPSRAETFCVAAAEALAAGRPVIMPSRGGQRDFVNARNGRLVSDPSAEAFGRAVLEVASDESLATPQQMAVEIRNKYSAAAVSDQLTALYREATELADSERPRARALALTRRAPSR